jgi:tRNA G18 (ribose-2'-O)-methylase SpoU
MGSCLHIPIYLCDYCDFELLVKNYAPNLYAADLDRSSRLVDSHFQWNPYPWLIIGNESHGVSPELKALANSVHIMIGSSVDSLNAAVAGSILLYAISQSTS